MKKQSFDVTYEALRANHAEILRVLKGCRAVIHTYDPDHSFLDLINKEIKKAETL